MPSGIERASLTTTPSTSITGPGRRRGQPAPSLGHTDAAAGEPLDGEDGEASAQVARYGGGGEDGRPVAVESQRGDEAHSVELHRRAQLYPGRHGGAVDLGP